MVTRLLEAEAGDLVCLEVFDDVGVEHANGTRVAEQTKSTKGGNPLSDRALALWKTMANWLDAVDRGLLPPSKTHFEIFVSRVVKPGEICKSFAQANDVVAAEAAVTAARKKLWGRPPSYPLKAKVAATIRPYVDRVLRRPDSDVAAVIMRMHVVMGRRNAYSNIHELLRKKLVSDDALDAVGKWAVGWVKQSTDEMMQRGEPARIAHESFHDALRNYVRKHDRDTTLQSVAGHPDRTSIERERTFRTYVDQLTIVQASEEDVLAAVSDFLRAAADRTFWAAKGHLDGAQLDEFADELRTSWRNLKQRIEIVHRSLMPEERGQLLLAECNGHLANPGGLLCPPHFTRGSFHALADDRTIGWHPDYTKVLMQGPGARNGKPGEPSE